MKFSTTKGQGTRETLPFQLLFFPLLLRTVKILSLQNIHSGVEGSSTVRKMEGELQSAAAKNTFYFSVSLFILQIPALNFHVK